MMIFPWNRRTISNNLFILLAVVSLLLALGSDSPIPVSKLFSRIPLLAQFRHPGRYFCFFIFFTSLGGALVAQRMFAKREWVQFVMALMVVILILCNLAPSVSRFWLRRGAVYPPLPPDFKEKFTSDAPSGRHRVAGPVMETEFTYAFSAPDYPFSMLGNFATLYGIMSFNKYNTITWYHAFSRRYFEMYNRDFQAGCRAYGVRWIIQHPYMPYDARLLRGLGNPDRIGGMRVWEIRDPSPMAFTSGRPRLSLPITFSARGASVQVADEEIGDGDWIVVNVLAWPEFRAYLNKKEIGWKHDNWGRLMVWVPKGGGLVDIVYSPPWKQGILLGIGLLLCAGIAYCVMARVFRSECSTITQ